MKSFPVKAILNRVIIEPLVLREQTKSGIWIPDKARDRRFAQLGIAVSSGKGGKDQEMEVNPGDVVLHAPYAGQDLDLQVVFNSDDYGKEILYKCLDQNDIFGVIPPDDPRYENVINNHDRQKLTDNE